MSSDEERTTMTDEALSALIDGELGAEETRVLRERLAREPALAARHAELGALDRRLRERPAPPLPADLHARLRARIAAETTDTTETPETTAIAERPSPPRSRAPLRPRRRWLPAAVALAAGLALYLAVVPRSETPDTPPQTVARAPEPAPGTVAEPAPTLTPAPAPALAPAPTPAPTRLAEAELPDESLAIALQLDTLEDFELIDQLELLELIDALAPETI